MAPIQTLLVANRAEIARRIFRTCHDLGIRTVAVFSEADRGLAHVREADQAVCIGPPAPEASYLDAKAIIEAARRTGADAIHPGYGFLAENASFAEAVAAAGLVWVGPPPSAMRLLGDKSAARRLAASHDVAPLPGHDGEDQSVAAFVQAAGRIGFPLLVKAAAGGGGRGMRLVERAEDLPAALQAAGREARAAFGSDRLLLERYLPRPRHVEVQVLADLHGGVIHLFERECSIQRRHQKIIEEAPSPAVDAELRRRMGEAAVRLVRAAGYAGAGTVEFLLDERGAFFFLGITAVGLLPVHDFNGGEPLGTDPVTGRPLRNVWGYNTLAFFAPEKRYAENPGAGRQVLELKEMVKRLHQAGIEVYLDVVFNHTGEGDELGPTLSFRGLDNSVYYLLDGSRRYINYSGCGNTLNCNHPVVKQLILSSLRYWVVEMHIDGFRFDLATILGRNTKGEWIGDLSLLYDIGGDPVLRGCKLIAEAWDADGMYKVGGFPEGWAEWNGRFRDEMRRYVRGDRGMVPLVARRLGGSRDLFGEKRSPDHSINFITAHDGFTLRDLVSYRQKHNERNGEDNRDGTSESFSESYGVEGETDDAGIRELRLRQAKNLAALLLLARGTPMLLYGDELWRTQQGNNNTYCQDNELSWLDWTGKGEAEKMQRFIRSLVLLRRRHPALRRPCFVDPFATDGAGVGGRVGSDITWHGVRLCCPDWSYHSHALALHIHGLPPATAPGTSDADFYFISNSWTQALDFQLPDLPGPARWHRLADTSLAPPLDIVEEEEAELLTKDTYMAGPRSVVVLIER